MHYSRQFIKKRWVDRRDRRRHRYNLTVIPLLQIRFCVAKINVSSQAIAACGHAFSTARGWNTIHHRYVDCSAWLSSHESVLYTMIPHNKPQSGLHCFQSISCRLPPYLTLHCIVHMHIPKVYNIECVALSRGSGKSKGADRGQDSSTSKTYTPCGV